jgi:putative transcriptional regulator
MNNRIQELINQKGMIQGDLAERCGVRREYINRIINGNIIPSVYLAIKIARALGTSVESVFILPPV